MAVTYVSTRPAALLGLARGVIRMFVGGAGLLACVWGASVLPVARRDFAIGEISRSVIGAEKYRDGELAAYVPVLDRIERAKDSRPKALFDVMTIRLRLLEDAIGDGRRTDIASRVGALRQSIIRLLSAAPTDSFGWLTLFWLANFETGFSQPHLNFLRRSYEFGPNEGWIALHRNRLTVALLGELPPDLAAQVATEFVRLVDSGFYKEAAQTLIGPGWRNRRMLLSRLVGASLRNRSLLAHYLFGLGYPVDVPGIPIPELRPWQ